MAVKMTADISRILVLFAIENEVMELKNDRHSWLKISFPPTLRRNLACVTST